MLTTFLAVLEAGSVSAAARVLHLSQPAVTGQLRRLEAAVGAALFVRSVHGVSPTAAGLQLASYARAVRRTLEEALGAVVGLPEEEEGELVVGASTTIAAHVLPALLARFRTSHPRVALRVDVGNSEHVVRAVREGRAPLGLVEGHARVAGVRLEPFLDDEIIPVMGLQASYEIHDAKSLERVPLLWRERGSGTRAVVERALVKAGIERDAIRALDVELGSTEAILGGAAAGLGVAFVSRASAAALLAAGALRVVPRIELPLRRAFRWALPSGALVGLAARFHRLAGAPDTPHAARRRAS